VESGASRDRIQGSLQKLIQKKKRKKSWLAEDQIQGEKNKSNAEPFEEEEKHQKRRQLGLFQ